MADNLSPYYSAGTATLTNGSAAVTGQSSVWLSGQLRAGDRIESDAGEVATILTIDSDTAITLDKAFKGTSQAAAAYKIWRTTDAQFLMESARKAYSLLGAGGIQALAGLTGSANKFPMFSGPNTMTLLSRQDITNGVKFDARVDTLAHRATYDASAADFSVLVSDIGDGRAAIYTKNTATSGDWSDPAYITGAIATVEVGDTTTGDYGSNAEVVPTPIAGGVSLAFTIPGSPSIEVGSTTTLPPGSAATVEPTPVAGGVSLAFGVPAGKGFAFGGIYDNATAYVLGDVVRDNGSSWIALRATTGNAPPVYPTTSNAYWELLALKGLDGTGTGDVVGPSAASAGGVAIFDGTTGKLVTDGADASQRGTIAALSVAGTLALAPIHVGDRDQINSNNAMILIARDFDGAGTLGADDGHAFSDSTNVSRTGGVAYNSFDARVDITGDNYNHFAGFQSDPDINISGTMTNYFGAISAGNVIAGIVTNFYGHYTANMYGGGTVGTQYGLYVAALTKGAINWAVYTAGATASYFGGPLDLSGSAAGQIKFPATQNASSNVNTLDDYEEGSWTPTIAATTGTITSTTGVSGTYTKIGNRVFFELMLSITTNGTGAGFVTATLPFTIGPVNFVCVGAINSGGSSALYGVAAAGTNKILINTAAGAYPGADGRSFTMSGSFAV